MRLAATFRAFGEVLIEAETDDEAIAQARAIDFAERTFVLDDPAVLEGDECVSVENLTDTILDWEDRPRPGEPMSWEAVRFVKDIAAGNIGVDLIWRARQICKLPPL